MNILVIEDNSIAAAYLKHKLQHLKEVFPEVRVELALSLRSADHILASFKPDVITLDLSLEGNENQDYVVKRIPELVSIAPVIVITMADLDILSSQELLALGVSTILDKDQMTSQAFLSQILSICLKAAPGEALVAPSEAGS